MKCQEADCSDFPELEFTILKSEASGETFTLSFKDVLIERNKDYFYYLKIQVSDQPMGDKMMWILGQDLFHKYYTVFDTRNMRIGYIEQISVPVLI
jgi:hypothetical protein